MKAFVSLCLVGVLLVCGSVFCRAQTPDKCEPLRKQISQFIEQVDFDALPPRMQRFYKESLLKLYTELKECLEEEIAGTTNPQRLSALRIEKVNTESNITILEVNLRSKVTGSNRAVSSAAPSPEAAENLSAPAANQVDVTASSAAPAPTPAAAPAATTSTQVNPTSVTGSSAAPTGQPANVCAKVLPGEDYPDPPSILLDIADKAAADVVRRKAPVRAIFPRTQMVLYTVFDAASPNSSKIVRSLEAYQYLSETARTDKQLGASANSDGAVSAIEKPSFAQLLGLAVEHGGITKKNDGTNLTLSTSLYSLYAMNGGDTAETYRRAGILNRIGVSATFAVDNKTNDLANARRNNLSQWSVKARLFGDRSTRAPGFQKFWNEKVRPLISERLQSLGSAVESLSTRLGSYNDIEGALSRCLPEQVKKRMEDADYVAAADDAKKKMISNLILSYLRSNVFNQVQGGSLKLKDKDIADIEQEFLPRLRSSLDNLVLADAEVKKEIDNLQKGPLATFAYTNYRMPTGSDYSETKFLFEQDKSFLRPLKLTGNFGLSFYNKPDPTLKQRKLRDITAALSFEGTSNSPFTEAENQSKITYSFVGRYEHLFENSGLAMRTPDIKTFQFVMEIPFFKGLSLPLSATYANGTEEEKKNHFKFNFGMRLDTDKLFEVLKAGTNH